MYLTKEELLESLSVLDLSDEKNGIHAINIIMNDILNKLQNTFNLNPIVIRNSPIVSIEKNYDKLYYPNDTITKSTRYTKYVDEYNVLRTHVTSGIIDVLNNHNENDSIYVLPGLVYRRDVIDRNHIGTPTQMDIWRVSSIKRYNREDLLILVQTILDAILPNCKWRYNETSHYYTKDGIEVEVYHNNEWLEILECGLILPELLNDNGLDSNVFSGLALGIGLDRSVMIRKNITDIRLLRHSDTRISKQMINLNTYKEISNYPHIIRDISIAISNHIDDELLGDKIRTFILNNDWIEKINIKSETKYEELPVHVSERLGMNDKLKNVLVSIKLRALDHTLTKQEANSIIEQLYRDIHEGTKGYVI